MKQGNQDQINRLNAGVAKWNEWRLKHSDAEIDLTRADLMCMNLEEANLSGAKLSHVNLTGADLTKAQLTGATLFNAELGATTLTMANFAGANLNSANLRGATANGADFSDANLGEANLVRVDFNGATLTGAKLYGAAREDWNIKDVICQSIFVMADTNIKTPKDRHFRTGEFEQLYAQLPMFEYLFEHGISLLDMAIVDRIVNDIRNLHPEWELSIDSFQARAEPRAVFTIVDSTLITHVFDQIKTKYEETLNRLEGGREESDRKFSIMLDKITGRSSVQDVNINNGNITQQYFNAKNIEIDVVKNQINNQQIVIKNEDLGQLQEELTLLSNKLSERVSTQADKNAQTEVGNALEAAKKGQTDAVSTYLKSAGKKALEVSEKIGVSLVTSVLKQQLGL